TISVAVTGDSSNGYFTGGPYAGRRFDWQSVGDQSLVRDTLGILKGTSATINLSGLFSGLITLANKQIGFGLGLDHGTATAQGNGSGFEWGDFPAITASATATGEEWTQN